MAGEEYESPVTGLKYTVPKYEEPADAPLAFKDFADSITVGGPASRENAVLQALEGDSGLAWAEGMALSVVDSVPADTDGEIGDVVFIPDGSGGAPAAPVGKVLQVVQDFYATPTEVASDSYQNAGGSVIITPSDASSKVLVQIEIFLHLSCTTNDDVYGYVQLMRNGVPIKDFGNVNRIRAAVGASSMTHVSTRTPITFLDSPSTTSACTYSLQIKVNNTANARLIIAHGVGGVATFTAMEVAQ